MERRWNEWGHAPNPIVSVAIHVLASAAKLRCFGQTPNVYCGVSVSVLISTACSTVQPRDVRYWPKTNIYSPSIAPTPSRVEIPSTAKTPAAIECTSFIGILLASLSPMSTAGTSAINMPSVVPITTSNGSP